MRGDWTFPDDILGANVQLVRVALRQFVDNYQECQQAMIVTVAKRIVQAVEGALPTGSHISFVLEAPIVEDVPFGKEVLCVAKGIVRSSLS